MSLNQKEMAFLILNIGMAIEILRVVAEKDDIWITEHKLDTLLIEFWGDGRLVWVGKERKCV